jgi:DNA-binding NtrC family response regulator
VNPSLLIVDDEPTIRVAIRRYMEASGFKVDEAASCEEARVAAGRQRFAAAVLDYRLPDGTGVELMPDLRRLDPDLPIVLLSAHATVEVAVAAVKDGASHVLIKPVELGALLQVLRREIENAQARRQKAARGTRSASIDPFFGQSAAIRELEDRAKRVLDSDRPVLLMGETGTGKGVLAEWLHQHGTRRDEPLVDINCASLPRELLESELFGHGKGAFTGAVGAKVGLFEVADRGTLFLDEIGDMDLAVQPRLLKVLEGGRFRRLGEVEERDADVRLITATHVDLEGHVREKKFRSDLFFRISILPLQVPPLRQRPEDIPLLARRILERLGSELGRHDLELTPEALVALTRYAWPGNVRELKNRLERAALLGSRGRLTAADLTPSTAVPALDDESLLTMLELEKRHLQRALDRSRGDVEAAARQLGLSRSSLYSKIQRYGLRSSKS